jgi:hypothetical protein
MASHWRNRCRDRLFGPLRLQHTVFPALAVHTLPELVAEVNILEQIRIIFLDSLSTDDWT